MNVKDFPIISIGGVLIGGIFAYKLAQKFGLIKTASERQDQNLIKSGENVNDANNIWSPTAKIPKGAYLLKMETGKLLSKKLWDAHSWYNDNEEAIYSVFRALKSQSQVSSLASWFSAFYKEDLYFWLKGILSESEFVTVLKIVNSKPKNK